MLFQPSRSLLIDIWLNEPNCIILHKKISDSVKNVLLSVLKLSDKIDIQVEAFKLAPANNLKISHLSKIFQTNVSLCPKRDLKASFFVVLFII